MTSARWSAGDGAKRPSTSTMPATPPTRRAGWSTASPPNSAANEKTLAKDSAELASIRRRARSGAPRSTSPTRCRIGCRDGVATIARLRTALASRRLELDRRVAAATRALRCSKSDAGRSKSIPPERRRPRGVGGVVRRRQSLERLAGGSSSIEERLDAAVVDGVGRARPSDRGEPGAPRSARRRPAPATSSNGRWRRS